MLYFQFEDSEVVVLWPIYEAYLTEIYSQADKSLTYILPFHVGGNKFEIRIKF
jgi:hypothetical protein